MSHNKNHSRRKFIQQTSLAGTGIIVVNALQYFSQALATDQPIASKIIGNKDDMNSKIKIRIGSTTFSASLEKNATATTFKALLPMTINMIELNGNEKYFNLSSNLPTNASNQSTIQNGDLMMYGASTVVLFYKTFSTSYSYTRLGRVDNPSGLAAALGHGNVEVTFELQ